VNVPKFEQALISHEFLARIREDLESGLRSGVQGTPTFFINGRCYTGPTEVDALLAAMQQAGP